MFSEPTLHIFVMFHGHDYYDAFYNPGLRKCKEIRTQKKESMLHLRSEIPESALRDQWSWL